MNFNQYSLDQMEEMYRQGRITDEQMTTYLRAWNAGPHFTQAVFADGAIRNFDPETRAYCHLWKTYGVRL